MLDETTVLFKPLTLHYFLIADNYYKLLLRLLELVKTAKKKKKNDKKATIYSIFSYIYSLTCTFALLVSISILFLRIAKKASKK